MDRFSSQPQQPPQQLQSRRPKNDSFRPALRFPTDPHKPGSLPQKIQHIVAPAPAAILLQSRRKPWEVDSTRLEDLIASTAHARKVIVVLGGEWEAGRAGSADGEVSFWCHRPPPP